jgi:predicted dehydrogenase
MRIGVVGCRRGGSFLAGLKAAGFSLTAAMDPDKEALGEFSADNGISESARFTSYAALLDHGVDAVVLGSPMPFHAPQAVLALEVGVHVLSEVTAAVSIDQCLRLRDAVRASKAAYMMAENYVYTRTAQVVKSMALAGIFGEIYFAEGAYLHDVRDIVAMPDGSFTWRKFWQMGRRGLTYPTHSLGPVLQSMDDRVVSLSARGSGIHTDPAYEGDDTAVMLCKTAKGGMVTIRTDLHSRRPHNMEYFQLQGTKGCYESPRGLGDDHKIYLSERHDSAEWYPLSDFENEFLPEDWRAHGEAASEAGHGGGDYVQILDFARACNGAPPAVDVYAALDWTLPGLISELSVEQGGTPMAVPDPRTEELDRAAEEERDSGRTAKLGGLV